MMQAQAGAVTGVRQFDQISWPGLGAEHLVS